MVQPTTPQAQIAEARQRVNAEVERLALLVANDARQDGRASGFEQGLVKGREGHAQVVKFPVLPADVEAALAGLDPIVRLLADAGEDADTKALTQGAIKARAVLANVLAACTKAQEAPAPAKPANPFARNGASGVTRSADDATMRVEPTTPPHDTDAQYDAREAKYRTDVRDHYVNADRIAWLDTVRDCAKIGAERPAWTPKPEAAEWAEAKRDVVAKRIEAIFA